MLIQDIHEVFNPNDDFTSVQSALAVDIGLGNPEISLVKLILGENLSWLPNNPIRTALLVGHEACNKYVGELANAKWVEL